MQVQPYLFFDGRCDEALEFYKKVLGAKVDMLMRFKDAPDQSMISPGSHDKVMHAQFRSATPRCWPPTAAIPASRSSTALRWPSPRPAKPMPTRCSRRWAKAAK